jgi:nucleotide-binding universal stress UspA family protein
VPAEIDKLWDVAGVFDSVVCAVDRSDESLAAAHQAARLVAPDGKLVLASAIELEVAAQAGWAAASVAQELQGDAQVALDQAHKAIAPTHACETRLIDGPTEAGLLDEVEKEGATLLTLGTHGHGRMTGILIGSLTTTLLHDATCSVLIARKRQQEGEFPTSIVVGVDGSSEAAAALAAASVLHARFGGTLSQLLATGGKNVDPGAVAEAHPAVKEVRGKPVDVLVEASKEADLLVIGSRGKHGVRALGSVSERVAHQAHCSVLVVRQP